jgi:hypothetical protein
MKLILPGVSLMNILPLSSTAARVDCPGCGAVQFFAGETAGDTVSAVFHHRNDACPVLARVRGVAAGREPGVVRAYFFPSGS